MQDFSKIEANAQQIVGAIGRESVDVYVFLSNEFDRGSITENHVFQAGGGYKGAGAFRWLRWGNPQAREKMLLVSRSWRAISRVTICDYFRGKTRSKFAISTEILFFGNFS